MRRIATAAALWGAALGIGTAAAQPVEPDWPCVQRKVAHLSVGQMWTGPIPEDKGRWREDPDLAARAAEIAARRTPLDAAEALIADVAAADGRSRAERLTDLFMGAFTLIDRERADIVEGVTRYARKQEALSERLAARRAEIAALEAETAADDADALDRLDEHRDALAWDVRVFDERRRSLGYVCESPVILEQRAFALARMVAAEMEGG